MGIPHLYTHLRPYARPETFPHPAPVPLFIDGPGLAHHVYQLALSSTPLAASANPWDAALGYCVFQAALVRYLDELSAAQLHIRKIYFDGHLPASKRPTRRSRLDDALRRLKAYHSLHPAHALPSCRSTQPPPPPSAPAFTPSAVYTPRATPLSAPPFILAAAIDALTSHPAYRSTVATVPAEAESYCARDAIAASGIVLTGDSDLLLFAAAAPPPRGDDGWGVLMFRDVTLAFPGAVGVVFRPCQIAATLGVDLAFLGHLLQADPHASFPVLQQRVKRIEARKRSGVAVGEYGKGWREFRAVYELPAQGEEGAGGGGVEPRIAELLDSRGRGAEGVTMWLPFLWEDPARGSAWDAGRGARAAAYGLVFKEGVMEVCRRGQRISEAFVHSVEPAGVLERVAGGGVGHWWVRAILDDVVAVYEERGQTPPDKSLLEGLAYMLSPPPPQTAAPVERPGPRKWNWEKVQVFAMAQAAWYSLLVLKEVLAATAKDGCRDGFETFPGVAECIDGGRFLDGVSLAGEHEKRAVREVLAAYHARIQSADSGEDIDIDTVGNGNGKRSSSRELRAGTGSEKKNKKKKQKKKRGKDARQDESSNTAEVRNIFELLAD
ncbi:XPG domain containing-domain-containing protein [Morchella snyderi]|nr:XPG domain containing-domain-containing protein [Morchella snyderi]